MAETILTPKQRSLLSLLFSQEYIRSQFYLTGGTALAEFYLHHRKSEDLDFFCEVEIDPLSIQTVLKNIREQSGFSRIDFQQSFNRNLFFLHFPDREIIKTEFTYYPFTPIEKPSSRNDIKIDSLLDIAVNKAFTLYQKPRLRDFIDLYFILVKQRWIFSDLLKNARIKFDTAIDPLQLGQQLMTVGEFEDFPRMMVDFSRKEMRNFWMDEIKKLKNQVLK